MPRPDGRVELLFSVRDTGIGIPLEHQAKLFQPFTQADSSTVRRFGGTGLGLVLVKRLVEAMEGSVRLESQDGVGTTLFADIPLALDEAAQGTSTEGEELAGKHILIIDDLAINRVLLGRQIKAHGGRVTAASSGAEALQLIDAAIGREALFDVVLVDLHMPPGMDGVTFGQMVRSDPRCRSMALVVLTATGARGEAVGLAKLGFDGYLLKPIGGATLARVLKSSIQKAEGHSSETVITRHSVTEAQDKRHPESHFTLQASILLVEDHEEIWDFLSRRLRRRGYEVVVATDGQE